MGKNAIAKMHCGEKGDSIALYFKVQSLGNNRKYLQLVYKCINKDFF